MAGESCITHACHKEQQNSEGLVIWQSRNQTYVTQNDITESHSNKLCYLMQM
jgi:hypothetical protein